MLVAVAVTVRKYRTVKKLAGRTDGMRSLEARMQPDLTRVWVTGKGTPNRPCLRTYAERLAVLSDFALTKPKIENLNFRLISLVIPAKAGIQIGRIGKLPI